MAEHYHNPELKVVHIAESVFVSERTLRRKCKQWFDSNPADVLSRYRIERSKQLLQSNKSVGDISLEVGFCSHSHFSAQFKKYVGTSPQNYRDVA